MKASEYINYLVNGETYKLAIQDVGDLAVNPAVTVTFTGSSSDGLVITSVGHGLVDTQVIRVVNSGGALPGNLSASTDYYVRDVGDAGANTFRLATSSGGAAIAHSSNGTGTNSWYYAVTTLQEPNRQKLINI